MGHDTPPQVTFVWRATTEVTNFEKYLFNEKVITTAHEHADFLISLRRIDAELTSTITYATQNRSPEIIACKPPSSPIN